VRVVKARTRDSGGPLIPVAGCAAGHRSEAGESRRSMRQAHDGDYTVRPRHIV
jgi:hypothetical protein